MTLALLIARLLLAATFVVAGLAKLTGLTGSWQALQAFGGGCSSRNSLRTTLFIKQT
jgi:uncharacterized membrane protein YphA (DoxX/SURF4 family)